LLCDLCFREASELEQENQVAHLDALKQQFHQEMLQVGKFAIQYNIGIRFLGMVEQ
jgi:hypothetical protein